jgi:hypothetical protein
MRTYPIVIVAAVSIAFGAPFTRPPSAFAQADCAQWDVTGQWRFDQSNGYWVDLNLRQTDSQLTGSGSYASKETSWGVTFGDPRGRVEGNVSGNAVSIVVHWSLGGIGEYSGTISPQGWLSGEVKDRMHPQNNARWAGVDKTANCIRRVSPGFITQYPPSKGGGFAVTYPLQPKERLATANNDVDIYDSPTVPRKVLAIMIAGTQGQILEHHPDGWCKLDKLQSKQPAGVVSGWVAQDHLTGCP